MPRRASYRFDFELPSPSAWAKFQALFAAAGAGHSTMDHGDGYRTRHTITVDAEDKALFRQVSELYIRMPGAKVSPPWPVTGSDGSK